MSRVQNAQEGRSGETMFGQGGTAEISRDEIKWAKFLERQQKRMCKDFLDMFILNLEFKGLKKQYELTSKKIEVTMNPPSRYDEQMEQMFNDTRFANYGQLADRPEFSKYYLMKRYLKWDDEEIKENAESRKKDINLGFSEADDGGGGGGSRW